MKNKHLAESLLGDEFKMKHWYRLNNSHIICPWCFNMTIFYDKSDENECEVCRRRITEGDIENGII